MRIRLILGSVALFVFTAIVSVRLGAFQPESKRVVPMNSVCATFAQDEVKSVDAIEDAAFAETMGALREGSAQIVLCNGNDIAGAVKSSGESFRMPEEPVPSIVAGPSNPVWVAAYFGTDGSVPPAYKVRPVEITAKTIRVAYERVESPGRSCDLHAYVIWAPIGPISAGSYTLELFDVAADSIIATRPWQVNQ